MTRVTTHQPREGEEVKSIPGEACKIKLHLWDESPRCQSFELPVYLFEDIGSWIHEFTELTLWNVLQNLVLIKMC